MSVSAEKSFAERYLQQFRSLSRRIRRARVDKGLSQEDAAFQAGISIYTYTCVERGRATAGTTPNPTLDTVLRILWALELPPPDAWTSTA